MSGEETSNNFSKLKKLYSKQKQACRIILGLNKSNTSDTSVQDLGISALLLFMYQIEDKLTPKSLTNFNVQKLKLKKSKFAIAYRGPTIWNNISSKEIKCKASFFQYKTASKRLFKRL